MMGTYMSWQFYEEFGGWPEPGETYPDDLDAARDNEKTCRKDPCCQCPNCWDGDGTR